MEKETKKIRHNVYDYIESEFGSLSWKQKAYISAAFDEHAANKNDNLKEMIRKFVFANDKISGYLKKAKTLPMNPTLKIQIQTLELVSSWLNQDDN